MALTINEMREKAKAKRSQAITGLINVIRTRDGSVSPPIEGQKDVDDFNMSMLFGASQNENINWEKMGVEGLIRLYYRIIEKINGTVRNNIITNTNTSITVNSSIHQSANRLLNGSYQHSGFFKVVNNRPVFDTSGSSLTNNRHEANDNYENSIQGKIDDIMETLGQRSDLAPIGGRPWQDDNDWEKHVRDSVLGRRFTDVCPMDHKPGSVHHGIDPEWKFGSGEYDEPDDTPFPTGFTVAGYIDYWNPALNTKLNSFISECNTLIEYIELSKTTDESYFTNPNVIFGRNEDPQFETQNEWINKILTVIDFIQSVLAEHNTHGVSRRQILNDLLEELRDVLIGSGGFKSQLNEIVSTLNGQFGSVTNSNTLRGLRFLWIKSILDPNDGSRVSSNGLEVAIDTMRSNISKAEDEFGLYGLGPSEWIPTPEIVGMQIYWLPNQETLELEPKGYIVAWTGQDHVVGYNIEKSNDWDGENGTWTSILPAGNSYSVQEIDSNTGRVLTYYIDYDADIEGGQKPYYRVKAFDTGGSGDMSRIASQSALGEPKNIDDFPDGGETAVTVPGSQPPPPPVTIPEVPDTVPEGTLIWTTILTEEDAEDINKRIFKSEVPFDSSGTNLVVYVNGKLKNSGVDQDYVIDDYFTINFHESIAEDDEVTINVFIRNPDKDITSWKDPVENFAQLPQQANSDGDIRLVKDEHSIYQWSSGSWVLISAAADGEAWGSPVATVSELPLEGTDGEVRFVITQQTFYYFNGSQNQWLNVASQSMRWKDPVNTIEQLPETDNVTGDVRLVISESKLYLWTGSDWTSVIADAGNITISHSDLEDMPDLEGIIADHDARYYTEDEIDITVSDLQSQINALLNLIPSDSDELKGTFRHTGTIFRTGYLSYNSGSFVTLVPEQKFSRITTDPNFTLLNPETSQFNQADKGVLRLYINDVEVDHFDLEAAFDETYRSTGQKYPPETTNNGFITIMSVASYANYPNYQKGEFRVHIRGQNLVPGENKIKLIHELYEGNHETDDYIIFWDNFTAQVGFQNIQIQHESITSNKFLSGVRYYDLGDQLKIGFMATRLFDNTYAMPNQVEIDPELFGSNLYFINYQSPGASGVDIPSVGKTLQYEREIDINKENTLIVNPRLRLAGFDPHKKYDNFFSPHRNILINTYSIMSDDLNEYFVDEHYRLSELNDYDTIPSQITGQWNSENILQNNQLQVYDSKIIYPHINYGSFLPTQSVNYSGYTGARVYLRAFRSINPQNNGILFVEGYNIDDDNVKIYMKLPAQTGWLDLSRQYNIADFNGSDGDGCLINRSGYDLQWTSGGFSTANSGYIIIVRVEMLNSNAQPIQTISMKNW